MEAHSIAIRISEPSQIGNVRRTASNMAERLGLNGTEVGQVAIVATELATNLLQHAGGGTLLLRALRPDGSAGLEILALDSGRGMPDVSRCLEDGFSTAGTAGTGLGAVQRLAQVFDVYSEHGAGTAVLAQMGISPAGPVAASDRLDDPDMAEMEVGVVSVPKSGEDECGDAWAVQQGEGRFVFALADGLGHGPSAAQASLEAMRVFRDCVGCSPVEILDTAHTALRSTRGAAMSVAAVTPAAGEVRFAGVGNVAAVILNEDGSSRSMVSHNGTLGHQIHRLQEFVYPWSPGALLLMHSDGLGTQWNMERYRGLRRRHPSIVAGVLFRDYQRERDDVTVLVARAREDQDGSREGG